MKCSTLDKLLTVVFIIGMTVGTIIHGHFQWSDILEISLAALLFHIIRTVSTTGVSKLFRK
jgi:hypothetical protein